MTKPVSLALSFLLVCCGIFVLSRIESWWAALAAVAAFLIGWTAKAMKDSPEA